MVDTLFLEMTVWIKRREPTPANPNIFSLNVDGRAYPHVSSGSYFGIGTSHPSREKAEEALREFIEHEKKWFSVYGRPIEVKLKTKPEVNTKLDDFFVIPGEVEELE